MNPISSFGSLKDHPRTKEFALFVAGAILVWSVGIPALFSTASAAQLQLFEDTLTDSAPSLASNHALSFTSTSTMSAQQYFRIYVDPTGQSFDLSALATSSTDVTVTGMTMVATAAACGVPASEVYVNRIDTTSDYVEIKLCTGDTVAAGAKTVNFVNNHIVNPAATGSYIIRINGSIGDAGDTRVAIVPVVTMMAAVDTSFTFTITGVASSTNVNGVDVSTTTVNTPYLIGFGTLSVGTSSSAAQHLAVTTNARNGFSVTVQADQDLKSFTGADIDFFKDGSQVAVPTAWTTPLGTLGTEDTYGHFGITSEDATLTAGDEFGSALYAGNLLTPREVFYNNGPADGTTANIGATNVAYRVMITALQEAANDYTNRIIYVATPTF